METIEILKQARKKDKEQFEKALAEAEERAQVRMLILLNTQRADIHELRTI